VTAGVAPPEQRPAAPGPPRLPPLRWKIAALLALATALSYLDRQCFPILVGEIRKEIPLTDVEYARLGSYFLLAYGLMYAGGGRILDALGTRRGYAVMILWWSAANFLTGTASSVLGLGVFRFLLGMGEGGGFPGSGKAVAEWFPAKERSLAFGIFNTGSALGAVIAAPLFAAIASQMGWRWAFFLGGAVGFVWVAFWLATYHPPGTHPRLRADERATLLGALPRDAPGGAGPRRWRDLFAYRQTWGLIVAKLLTDSAWFFFIFWLPKYLVDARGFDIGKIGAYAWIPYAFAGAGSLLGGLAGRVLIGRGVSIDRSRKIALGSAALLMPCSLLVVPAPSFGLAIAFFSVALFAHQFWSANVQTLGADIFPARLVGSIEGLIGSAGALGAALFGLVAGHLIGTRGYTIPFLVAGLVHPAAFAIILAVVRRIERVSLPSLVARFGSPVTFSLPLKNSCMAAPMPPSSIVRKSSSLASIVHWGAPEAPAWQVGGVETRSTVHVPPSAPPILNRYTAAMSLTLSGLVASTSGIFWSKKAFTDVAIESSVRAS
jgi:ACS family hexuronate transporter-like MFS transporter